MPDCVCVLSCDRVAVLLFRPGSEVCATIESLSSADEASASFASRPAQTTTRITTGQHPWSPTAHPPIAPRPAVFRSYRADRPPMAPADGLRRRAPSSRPRCRRCCPTSKTPTSPPSSSGRLAGCRRFSWSRDPCIRARPREASCCSVTPSRCHRRRGPSEDSRVPSSTRMRFTADLSLCFSSAGRQAILRPGCQLGTGGRLNPRPLPRAVRRRARRRRCRLHRRPSRRCARPRENVARL